MGICSSDNDTPILMCTFEYGNEVQKAYCLKLKDNFINPKSIKFEIKSFENSPFSIKFKYKGTVHEVQKVPDLSEDSMNNTLNKIYEILK